MVSNLVILKTRVFIACIILGFIITINFIYMYYVLKFVLKIQKGMICCEMPWLTSIGRTIRMFRIKSGIKDNQCGIILCVVLKNSTNTGRYCIVWKSAKHHHVVGSWICSNSPSNTYKVQKSKPSLNAIFFVGYNI